ncbi:MAG: hypothetical protein N3I35_13245 [Clostridia bacterium]|nr:hypothetical protein [Clostridia bacterium]
MKIITEEQIRRVKTRFFKEGGIQPQFVSLPEDYEDRVETTNGQSKKILEKISDAITLRV